MGKGDHYAVGREHAAAGQPRYKFQDPNLQREYDAGYDSYNGYDMAADMPGPLERERRRRQLEGVPTSYLKQNRRWDDD
jgi:hypothetical protein